MSSNKDPRTQRELIGAEWSARLVIVFLGLPSLGFAIVSGMFNASYASRLGHGQEQDVWIAASVLVTCFVTGLPLAIEILRAHVPHLAIAARGLWLASMVFSFIAAMGYAAVTRGQATAEASATIGNRSSLERAIARNEAALEALPRHRPTSTVLADIRAVEAERGVNCAKGKGREARELCAPYQRELAVSQDADRIEARLAEQRGQLDTLAIIGTSANPQADVLSWIGGGVLSPDIWERLLTVFIAGLIEVSAALGLAITARSVVELLAAPQPVPAPAPAPVEVVTPEVLEPSPLAAVEPELGWQMWFQACVTAQRGGKITPKDAYAHYEAWAGLNNVGSVLPYVTFGRRMSEAVAALGGKIGRSAGRYYGDVSLTKLGLNGVSLIEDKEAGE